MNEDNGKGYGCFVMLVSGVSIVFSIVALLKHDNRNCEISPSGFVIATLSALITFVVAWQIWQTIASREQISGLEEKIRANADKSMYINLYHVFLFQGDSESSRRRYDVALNYYFRSLDCAINGNIGKKEIRELIKKINGLKSDDIKIEISLNDCETYLEIIKSIESTLKDDIINFLKSIKSDDAPDQGTSWSNMTNSESYEPES